MDIKLQAKLSAYSKIELPVCPGSDTESITKEQIDSLFDDNTQPKRVPNEAIDSLFR